MTQATLASYYRSSAFDPPEYALLPSEFITGNFDDELLEILDKIEEKENLGCAINWYVAAIKCSELILTEKQYCEECEEWEFDINEMIDDLTKIVKSCD